MGMKLIKNISPTGIKVSISVIKTDGQNTTIDLNHGDYIVVSDTGAETKSIIIQKRKGNIDVSDYNQEGVVPYEKYSTNKEEVIPEFINNQIVEIEEISGPPQEIVDEHNLWGTTTTESETVVVKNKGGRPKGSFKKKGPGRPKKKKSNKKKDK